MENKLSDITRRLKDAGINSLEYFHCDHFEPWAENVGDGNYIPNYQGGSTELFEDKKSLIEMFVNQSESAWYSKKLTLFYLPALLSMHQDEDSTNSLLKNSGDEIGFVQYDDRVQQLMAEALSRVSESTHEIQLHLHHESFTSSEQRQNFNIRQWLESHGTPVQDEARLRLALEYTKNLIKNDTGVDLKTWAFVHGKWALNASDRSVCRISNELSILKNAGCFGDFTFPAGRKNTNPTEILLPYTCIPKSVDKCYDSKISSPLAITDKLSKSVDRFFIWNSVLQHNGASLDYYSDVVKNSFSDPSEVVFNWITKSPILNNKIYLKTHAHSLATQYWKDGKNLVIPHQWPAIKEAFNLLYDCLISSGIEVNCRTVSEVYSELMHTDEIIHNTFDCEKLAIDKEFKSQADISERSLKTEMDLLWKNNDSDSRSKSIDIANYLYSTYSTKNAIYLLGLAFYLGKGIEKNWELAYFYFSHSKLSDNATVSFYKAMIILSKPPSSQNKVLADTFIAEAVENNISQAISWVAENNLEKQFIQA